MVFVVSFSVGRWLVFTLIARFRYNFLAVLFYIQSIRQQTSTMYVRAINDILIWPIAHKWIRMKEIKYTRHEPDYELHGDTHAHTHTQHIQKSFTMNAAKSVIQITQIGIEQIFSHWFIPYHIRAHKITDYEKKKSIPKGERKHIVNRFVQRYHEYVVELVLSWKFQWLTPFKLTENCCVIEKRIKIKLKEK